MENATLRFRDSAVTMLSVRSFEVEEAMSGLFELRVRAVSPILSLDLPQLAGHPASFELHANAVRRWHGLCVAAEFVRVAEEGDGLATYEFVVRPELWRLTQRVNNRLMQHLTIPEMVTRLLEEWGIVHEWRIAREQYPTLELRTQFGETDFAFFSRLLEEAGISYWFAEPGPDEAVSRLVLGDTPTSNEERLGLPIGFTDNPSLVQSGHTSFVTNVRVRELSVPGRVTLREYDYRRARVPIYAQADSARTEEHAHEQYTYAHGAFQAEGAPEPGQTTPVADDMGIARHRNPHGQLLAQRRLESLDARRTELTFDTLLNDLPPGTIFRITGHPRDDIGADRPLLMTTFRLEGDIATPEEWKFSGRAVWTSRPYRPAQVTQKPRMHG
ncbi:MAG TPA: contractile injection system protein, VgrG/Pvc8 family, partial [Candidatus Nanopelagicales bacterium]|nr:contractile injection system protein, VgrG/Pvc8 family [Candidatus Nanopelagicales bacterium]